MGCTISWIYLLVNYHNCGKSFYFKGKTHYWAIFNSYFDRTRGWLWRIRSIAWQFDIFDGRRREHTTLMNHIRLGWSRGDCLNWSDDYCYFLWRDFGMIWINVWLIGKLNIGICWRLWRWKVGDVDRTSFVTEDEDLWWWWQKWAKIQLMMGCWSMVAGDWSKEFRRWPRNFCWTSCMRECSNLSL